MKHMYLKCMAVLLLSVITISAYAQQKVTGKVTEKSGEPIPGVSVTEKGTKNGTATDGSGRFSIAVKPGAVLTFSSIGLLTQQITVGANGTINVTMEDDSKALTEVVVTGFGTKTSTRKLSYSVSEVKGEELAKANNANIVNALQGKVAGVMINQGASGPQSSSKIRIRGNASLGNNTQPLVVIDGVLIEPGTTGADSWGDNADFGNIMKNLNSDDYESVSVLKGAAASALYGSKAQNGVLLISTKKGRKTDGLGINVSQTTSFDQAYKLANFQNQYGGGILPEFKKDANGVDVVEDIANINKGGYSYGPKFDGHMVKDLDGRMIPWKANDPLDFFQTGKFINSNVSVEGGSENTTFRLSYTNLHNSSILPNNALDRNTFAFRATQNISKTISIDGSVNYTMSDSKNPGRQGSRNNPLFAFTYYMPRHVDIPYYTQNYYNPAGGGLASKDADLHDPYRLGSWAFDFFEDRRTQKENNLLANVDVNVKVTPWLTALVKANINAYNTQYERKHRGKGIGFTGGTYQIDQSSNRSYRLQGLLSGSRKITDDLETTFAFGGETYQINVNNSGYFNSSYTDGGLKIPDLFSISNSLNPAITKSYPNPGKRTDAVYVYGDFTWKNMLTVNYSMRNDWSSTLTYKDGSGDHSYFYPSVGAAFTFTELPAFKDGNSILSFGKLRAAYSYTGLDAEAQLTNKAGYYNLNGSFNNESNGNQSVYGFSDRILKNSNLKNQLTKELEIGADLRFFKDRLGFDISYYKRNSTNQILSFSLPMESGVTSQSLNAGDIQNQGIEILMTAKPVVTKDFTWNSTINFTRNKNKIISLVSGVDTYELDYAFGNDVVSVARVGGDYGTLLTGYGYSYYQKKDANGNPIDNPSNGKKVIGNTGYGTTGGYYTYVRNQDYIAGDKKELGSMMEKFMASTTQQFNYKNISLGFQIDAKVGGMMASGTHQYGSANGSLENSLFGRDAASGGVTYTDADGVVKHDGIIPDGVLNDGLISKGVDLGGMTYADAVGKGLLSPIPAYAYYENLTQWSSGIREYSVFENTWVALREVSVGYSLPKKLLSNIKVNSLSLTLTARNLGYIYKTAKDGINPEGIFSNRAGAFAEYGGWPYVRSLGFSIKAGF